MSFFKTVYPALSPIDKIMFWSLVYLHLLLGVFATAMLMGREAAIIGDAFAATLVAIIANLGAISGNKFLQNFSNKYVKSQTTVTTETAPSASPVAPAT